ncbi:putative integrase/recombinase y4rB [Verrucomicrobia bacterium]|nr:putative integrase/recombinase y4rB [Verrucomicrobiota bacterium]
MKRLNQAVNDYLVLRRGLGFKLPDYGACLRKFVSFLKKNRSSHITNKLAVEYATQCQDQKPVTQARTLGIIRGFARYRIGADPETQIPPVGLLRCRSQRARPHLYSEDEICRLLKAALAMKTTYQLQRHTYYCLFGLLAVTGMRLGEAMNLRPQDVDFSEGVITIRDGKFGKSRLVPVHPSTCAVLRDYAERRDKFLAGRPVTHFLMTGRGRKLDRPHLTKIFHNLSREVGIRKLGVRHGPRLHDFRHRFAIQTLLRWYRDREHVDRRMPILSTFLGHGSVRGTYWYLGSTPELMAAATKLIERRWKGVA